MILEKVLSGEKINFLLSPVLGSGIAVNTFENLLISCFKSEKADPSNYLKEKLIKLDEKIIFNDKMHDVTSKEGERIIDEQVSGFDKKKDLLTALGVL